MSKISGILSGSPRVNNADLSESLRQRRGAPVLDGMRHSDPSTRLQSSTLSAFDRLKARNLVQGPKGRTPLSEGQMNLKAQATEEFFTAPDTSKLKSSTSDVLMTPVTQSAPSIDGKGGAVSIKA